MRMLILILAVLVFTDPAAAQSWQEYSYPDHSFRVSFPAAPQIDTTTYRVTDDKAVEAHVYSVRRDDAVFEVTVAELGDPGLTEAAVIEHAIKTLSEGGQVLVNIPHRINRVFGRQLSILEGDGSRAAVALFDYNGRFYQIDGKSPLGKDTTADAIRFVQSLIFTGGGSNRSAEEIQAAARAACSGLGEAGAAAVPGTVGPVDGRQADIRCRRRQSLAALISSLNSGDLSGAQQAYSSLSQLQGSGRPPFPNPNGPFAQAMSRIGQALQSGDLIGAQQALSSLPRPRRFNSQP